MTKDDIICMARVAGVRDDGHRFEFSEYKYLERFAALAAAAERAECAKVCENLAVQQDRDVRDECAAAIRARGEQA
jgi:hypothetical protein